MKRDEEERSKAKDEHAVYKKDASLRLMKVKEDLDTVLTDPNMIVVDDWVWINETNGLPKLTILVSKAHAYLIMHVVQEIKSLLTLGATTYNLPFILEWE